MEVRIKPEQQISSTFKSTTHRFKHVLEEKPGPGQYNVGISLMNHSLSFNTLPHHFEMGTKPSVPSIPVDNLGFREDENNEMKKVQPIDH